MPIFRKEAVQNKVRAERLERRSKTLSIENSAQRLIRVPAIKWEGEIATFGLIDAKTNHRLSSTINERVHAFPNRKVNVLDWGCYTSPAVRELARNPRLSVFGYSRDADPSMLVPEGVTYLQTGPRHLVKYFTKHKIKFDVIYSNGGLKNIPDHELVNYFVSLRDCLHEGGVIFPDVGWTPYRHKEFFSFLERSGFKLGFEHGDLVSLTRER